MPYVRCRLRIRRASSWSVPAGDFVGHDLLAGVDWDAKSATVEVSTGWGPIAVVAEQLDVELEITDEVVSVRRRRVGRILPFDSTTG
jgi:hypothetical protein